MSESHKKVAPRTKLKPRSAKARSAQKPKANSRKIDRPVSPTGKKTTLLAKLKSAVADSGPFKLIVKGIAPGVYVTAQGDTKLLCPPLKPLGNSVDPDGRNPAMRIKLCNRLGKVCDVEIPMTAFQSPKVLLQALIALGLDVDQDQTNSRAEAIHFYLRMTVPDRTYLRAKHDGWLSLPDDSWGYALDGILYCGEKPYKASRPSAAMSHHHKKGDLKTWQRTTRPLGDDVLAVAMVCAGFASPLLHPLHREAPCLFLIGPSSQGKTTLLKLVSALFSYPENMATWEATENGVEAATREYQHKPFPIDEVGQGRAQLFATAAYRLTNPKGKSRADSSGNLVKTERNFSVVLSSGEQSPISLIAASGREVKAGQRARLLCLPVAEKHGVWSTVRGFGSGAEKSKKITAALIQCHGIAGETFCKYLAARVERLEGDYATAAAKLRQKLANGNDIATTDGVVDRVLENFVLFAFAGLQAIEAGALAWSKEQVLQALRQSFALWHVDYLKSLPLTDEQLLEKLRLFFQSERGTKFKPFDQFDEAHAGVVAGYTHVPRGGTRRLFLVYPAYFEQKLCGDLDKDAVIRQLSNRGLIALGPRGVPTKQFHIPGSDNRSASFYAVRESILLP